MKNFIITSVNTILAWTIGVVLSAVFIIIGMYKVAHGSATKYTNVKYADSDIKYSFISLYKRFAKKQDAIALASDQGLLACVHGGFANFIVNGNQIGPCQMAMKFEKGYYTLLSCCNKSHCDFEMSGRSFIRDINTISYDMTIFIPVNGSLICWADKLTSIYGCIIDIRSWQYIPRLIKRKNWN